MASVLTRGSAVFLLVAGLIASPAPVAAQDDLFAILAAAGSDAARAAAIVAHPEAVTPEFQKTLVDQGTERRRAGQMTVAANAFLAAHDIAVRLGDRSRAAMALVSYSSVPGQLGDYPVAIKALDEALAIGESLHDNAVIGAALANVAIIDDLTGDYDGALEASRRSLALAIAADDHRLQGRAYNEMGIVYLRQGHFREALESYEKAIPLERETSAADAALTLSNIGGVYNDQGNIELALDYYTRSLAELEALDGGENADVSVQLINVATIQRDTGRLDAAIANIERARAISEKLGNRSGLAAAAYNMASVRERQGRPEDAVAGYRSAIELREALGDRYGLRVALHSMAVVLAGRGRTADALAAEARAVEIARALKSNELMWEPLRTIGDLRHRLHEPAAAETAYREAIAAIETIRKEVAGGSEARRRFFEDKLGAYRGLTTLLVEQDRGAEALAVAERARGRVLAELVEGPAQAAGSLTPAEHERQRALEREAVMLAASLSATERRRTPDPAAVQVATERLNTARRASDEFRDTLDAMYPTRRLARGDEPPDPLGAAAALLPDARTALIEYVVTDEVTHIFVVTRSVDGQLAVSMFKAALPSTALRTRVDALLQKLSGRALDFHADAAALYDILLKPARQALAGKTRLVIVPDEKLWTIPFGALEPSPGRVLLDTVAIVYAPSLAVLRAMHERPALRVENATASAPTLLVAADPASDLPRLPDAARQATALATLYGRNQSRVFTGGAATEPQVRAAAAGAAVLHFATHGVVDDTNPMYSFLQLTRAGTGDADGDGRLEAWEIQSLKLDASVAVLTACDTARGSIGGGEGVVGLAWAFFAAGTPATVVSLWQLESGSATTMTLEFHRRFRASLVAGHGEVADSLRAAALALRRDPRYRHPFYWAGLVAVGDGY